MKTFKNRAKVCRNMCYGIMSKHTLRKLFKNQKIKIILEKLEITRNVYPKRILLDFSNSTGNCCFSMSCTIKDKKTFDNIT